MTLRSNSRVAGYAFLVYIAAALTGMVLSGRASRGRGTPRGSSIASHLPVMRTAILLELVGCFCALVLAVTLYAITRDADPDLALLAMVCRVAEGVIRGRAAEEPREALARDGHRRRRAGPRGRDRARRPPVPAAELGLDPARDLLRRRQHALRLAAPARPDRRLARAAGRVRVDPGRRRPSPAARRGRRKPDHGRHVDADARLRAAARVPAHRPGRRDSAGTADVGEVLDLAPAGSSRTATL